MRREVLGSIWKIGRYPIKASEVLREIIIGSLTSLLNYLNTFNHGILCFCKHPASFKIWISKVQDFGNFELSPMIFRSVLLMVLFQVGGHWNKVSILWIDALHPNLTGPHNTVRNVSDCRSRGHKFDLGLVTYFRRLIMN